MIVDGAQILGHVHKKPVGSDLLFHHAEAEGRRSLPTKETVQSFNS